MLLLKNKKNTESMICECEDATDHFEPAFYDVFINNVYTYTYPINSRLL